MLKLASSWSIIRGRSVDNYPKNARSTESNLGLQEVIRGSISCESVKVALNIFTLSGLRGIIGEDLTVPDLQVLGRKFGSLMHGGRCAVGKDRDKVVSGSSLSVVRDIESLRVVTNGVGEANVVKKILHEEVTQGERVAAVASSVLPSINAGMGNSWP